MTTNIPPKLKSLDISRFVQRAAQLERFKPAVAYWCYYWAVNQILSKGLHVADDDCKVYTTSLMDKLEEMKTLNSKDPAILDDAAGQSLLENFGFETFQRAENAMRANKATMQTVDTFHAASTFLDVLQIWNSPGLELTQRIKYAKYHALRIVKAIKAGEDPNLSNPPETEQNADSIRLDPDDPEVKAINGTDRQASIAEISDPQHTLQPTGLAAESPLNPSLYQTRNTSTSPQRVSTERGATHLSGSLGSGPLNSSYFDQAPPQHLATSGPGLATGGRDSASVSPPSPNPPTLSQVSVSPAEGLTPDLKHATPLTFHNAHDFYSQRPSSSTTELGIVQDPSSLESMGSKGSQAQNTPIAKPLVSPQPQRLSPPLQQQHHTEPPSTSAPQSRPLDPHSLGTQPSYNTDDQSTADAQKHAKWAISALNFEDVNTAVKELRIALRALGAH